MAQIRRRLARRYPQKGWRKHARGIVLAFASVIATGTALLLLPAATRPEHSTDLVTAFFTATSAVCFTGLVVVDTPTHWSTFGELVILVLIQLGGMGIMTFASLLSLLMARRFRLRMQLTAQTETRALVLGDVRRVVIGVALISLIFEAITAAVLILRFLLGYGYGWAHAVYHGFFHAVSAFNNAGFTLYPDSITRFADDPWISLPITMAVVAGGLGFPIWIEIWRHHRDGTRRWSLHTKITVWTTSALFVIGIVVVTIGEWGNSATLGRLGTGGKLIAGVVHGVMPRTGGFNSLDVGAFESGTLLVNDILMFIGGGSAGTAGGIKVTTFAVLGSVILAEIRGEPSVHILRRQIGPPIQRQALTIALLGVAAVVGSTVFLLTVTSFSLDQVLFETVSAFGTVGLSTGITTELPPFGQLLLAGLMFLGRVGPITLTSALALRERTRRYEFPEERPIVG